MELRVGNKYRLGRKIGSGSFGDIYLGMFLNNNLFLHILVLSIYTQIVFINTGSVGQGFVHLCTRVIFLWVSLFLYEF